MRRTTFISIATFIFTLVAIFHLARVIFNWSMVLGTWEAPIWISYLGFLILGTMVINGVNILKRK